MKKFNGVFYNWCVTFVPCCIDDRKMMKSNRKFVNREGATSFDLVISAQVDHGFYAKINYCLRVIGG